ncbi:MAG TPA: protocatechuate 3,4-dioxygenase subunit beta [Burkholderiales bacterium]|nr:protocatechuate 3,4-dioxygenase subunit beta [Burkholderiales bacterium]
MANDLRARELEYPRESLAAHPPYRVTNYRATHLRAPTRPQIRIEPSAGELIGPAFGPDALTQPVCDLTRQGEGEPLGERIIVSGHVLTEDGMPLPHTLIEIWQANAAGRYVHEVDRHEAPIDPNFHGAGRVMTDGEGRYTFTTIKPGAYPVLDLDNVWRPSHIHFSLFGPSFLSRVVAQMYFPGDPLLELDSIYQSVPEYARPRLVATLDMTLTRPGWALGYRYDFVLRGRHRAPEARHG